MALVIENGSGSDPGANSYAAIAQLRAYAAARGKTLPVADAECEVAMTKAMDYLEAQRDRYTGMRTSRTQPLQWPRTGATVDGYLLAVDEIPHELVAAQLALAVEAAAGTDLLPTAGTASTGPVVAQEVVGAVKVQYAPGEARTRPLVQAAEGMLAALYGSRGVGLTVVRG